MLTTVYIIQDKDKNFTQTHLYISLQSLVQIRRDKYTCANTSQTPHNKQHVYARMITFCKDGNKQDKRKLNKHWREPFIESGRCAIDHTKNTNFLLLQEHIFRLI